MPSMWPYQGGSPGGGAATPGGSDGQLQVNSAGALGGVSFSAVAAAGALLTLSALAATDTPLVVKGYAAQSAPLQEWRNSSNTVVASVSNAGAVNLASIASTLNTFAIDVNGVLRLWTDCYLQRDASNTLALRNGANGNTARVYGTYTDASNYRRVALTMSTAGVAELKPQGAGTGASGNVLHISGLPTSNPGPGVLWNDAGSPAIGT